VDNVRFTGKADIVECDRHVRFVPKADSCIASNVAVAEAHYATSTALALERGMRPLVARCRFSLGELYGRAGDQRATEHLTSAISLFQEMGMRFWFDKAEAQMQALEDS